MPPPRSGLLAAGLVLLLAAPTAGAAGAASSPSARATCAGHAAPTLAGRAGPVAPPWHGGSWPTRALRLPAPPLTGVVDPVVPPSGNAVVVLEQQFPPLRPHPVPARVVSVDLANGAVTASPVQWTGPTAFGEAAFAEAGGRPWVALADGTRDGTVAATSLTLCALALRSLAPVGARRLHVPTRPWDAVAPVLLAGGPGTELWVAYGRWLWRLDPATGRVEAVTAAGPPGTEVSDLAVGPSGSPLYATLTGRLGTCPVRAFDPGDGAVLATSPDLCRELDCANSGPSLSPTGVGVWATCGNAMGYSGGLDLGRTTLRIEPFGPRSERGTTWALAPGTLFGMAAGGRTLYTLSEVPNLDAAGDSGVTTTCLSGGGARRGASTADTPGSSPPLTLVAAVTARSGAALVLVSVDRVLVVTAPATCAG